MATTTVVPAAIAEMEAARALLEPEIIGLARYLKIADLDGPTQADVESVHQDSVKRAGLLDAAIGALRNLIGDGYPKVEVKSLPGVEFVDLADELETLKRAFARFVSQGEVEAVDVSVSEQQPQ